MKRLLLLAALPACLPATINSEGPSIRVGVDVVDGFSFTNESFTKEMDKNTATGNYDFTIAVDTDWGMTVTVGREASDGYRYAEIAALDGTITPPDVTLTVDDFTFDHMFDDSHRRQYVGKTMYSIPGTMMGQMTTFHFIATDTNGLESNIVDFTAMLR